MTGIVFDIKEFSLHDGPGARTTIFLKGCPLRCSWCHNPEGLSNKPQLMIKHNLCKGCGKCTLPCVHEDCKPFSRCVHACPDGLITISGQEYSARNLANCLARNMDFYNSTGGGITFSGGEPLMQSDFLLEVISLLNCHTAIQTSGYADEEIFLRVIEKVDYIMMDIKIADRDLHKKHTGVYNDIILNNLEHLKKSKKEFVVRTPLIKGICDTEDNLKQIKELVGNSPWELLNQNELWRVKYSMLSI